MTGSGVRHVLDVPDQRSKPAPSPCTYCVGAGGEPREIAKCKWCYGIGVDWERSVLELAKFYRDQREGRFITVVDVQRSEVELRIVLSRRFLPGERRPGEFD